jgi:hypothetical protein
LTDGYNGAVCTVHASGDGYAVETGDNPKFEEACANARLIAAAPELLAAVILLLAAKDADTDKIASHVIDATESEGWKKARVAIASLQPIT